MFSAVLGISLIAHILIIFSVKVKNFLLFMVYGRARQRSKNTLFDRIFNSLAIATIMEFAILVIIISSFMIVKAGITSDKANYKILENAFYEFESKSNITDFCFSKDNCEPSHPDASVPII